MKTQDPKYDIEDGKLVNAATREPIPDDEPIFILRAKDKWAKRAVENYKTMCQDPEQRSSVNVRLGEFIDFSIDNKDRMKEPDTELK